MIAFEQAGDGESVLVFTHGLLMDRSSFARVIQGLSGRHRCIAWDRRGHGSTPVGRAPLGSDHQVLDLMTLMDALGVRRAVLCGHSQGGFLSARAAMVAPERVAGVVAIGTRLIATARRAGGSPATELVRRWRTEGPSDQLLDHLEQLLLGPDCPDAARWRAQWRDADPVVVARLFDALAAPEQPVLPAEAGEGAPLLLIHGENDAVAPAAPDAVAALANARLVVIEGAGHAPMLTHARRVSTEIARFAEALA